MNEVAVLPYSRILVKKQRDKKSPLEQHSNIGKGKIHW